MAKCTKLKKQSSISSPTKSNKPINILNDTIREDWNISISMIR